MEQLLSIIFTPLVIQTGLICLGSQLVLQGLFAYVLPEGPWTKLPAFTAHQLVCLPLMVWVSLFGTITWFGSDADTDRIFDKVEGGYLLAQVVVGFLLFWDIPVGLATRFTEDTLMLLHHLGMLFLSIMAVGGFSAGYSVASYYALFFFGVVELSTVFLTFMAVFHPKEKYWYEWLESSKDTTTIGKIMAAMNEVSRVGFALSYLALRTVYFPYVMATTCVSDFWKAAMLPTEQERHGTPSGIFWGVIVLAVLFTMLQMYWGTLVVRQLLKAMGIGSKTKKE